MYNIQIHNCNNIKEGTICIEPNKLNIKYGINGTGKTTIAKAIQYSVEEEKLSALQSYYTQDAASIAISPKFNKILVFNEEFINQIVFVEDEVIENSFERDELIIVNVQADTVQYRFIPKRFGDIA